MIKAILTKPLDGQPEGTEREFDKADFDRLKALGAVKAAPVVANKKAPSVSNKAAARAEEAEAQKRVAGLLDLARDKNVAIGEQATEVEIVAALTAAGVEIPQA